MTDAALTIRDLRLRSVAVPLKRPLVTRVVTIDKAAFVLIGLETEEGATGRAYLFGYSLAGNACFVPPLRWLADAMKGETVDPETLYPKARKALTLMGHEGIAMMAVSGFEMACWDAYAKAQGKPLVEVLGGKPGKVPAYNSNGLGLIGSEAVADEAQTLIAKGKYTAVKVRLGRETLDDDLTAFRAVRNAIGRISCCRWISTRVLTWMKPFCAARPLMRKTPIGLRSRSATTIWTATPALPATSKRRSRTAKTSTDQKPPPAPSRPRRWIT